MALSLGSRPVAVSDRHCPTLPGLSSRNLGYQRPSAELPYMIIPYYSDTMPTMSGITSIGLNILTLKLMSIEYFIHHAIGKLVKFTLYMTERHFIELFRQIDHPLIDRP